jgi:hypothetical protein
MLKEQLPCECDTEEWFVPSCLLLQHAEAYNFLHALVSHCCHVSTGTSALCAVNRSSIYILLFILISLASFAHDLCHSMNNTPGHKQRQSRLNVACYVFPILLLAVAHWFDTADPNVANGVLNIRYYS